MSTELKFTQEIKDKWIEALESGKFTQGYCQLENQINEELTLYCCIGVLGHITKGLDNTATNDTCPYHFLSNSGINDHDIWTLNDKFAPTRNKRPKDYKDDYSNVIEHIKNLPVQ